MSPALLVIIAIVVIALAQVLLKKASAVECPASSVDRIHGVGHVRVCRIVCVVFPHSQVLPAVQKQSDHDRGADRTDNVDWPADRRSHQWPPCTWIAMRGVVDLSDTFMMALTRAKESDRELPR